MSRCAICDHSNNDNAQSHFNEGITSHKKRKKLLHDKSTDNFYCEECYEGIRSTFSEYTKLKDIFYTELSDNVSYLSDITKGIYREREEEFNA